MKKLNTWFILASTGIIAHAIADNGPHQGYLNTTYGPVVKSSYGQCVHTSYYNPNDGIEECGEAPARPSPPPSKPKLKVVMETVTLSDADNILFTFNAATLTDKGEIALSDFIHKVDHESDITKITIEGYTDAMGKAEYNLHLSQARVDAVKQFLVSHGYPADKIIVTGYGAKAATASARCFTQYGPDPLNQIWAVQAQLESKKFTAKKLSKRLAKEKRALQAKLNSLNQARANLIKCAASDRKVVFTIEHTEQIAKTVTMGHGSASAPAVGQ